MSTQLAHAALVDRNIQGRTCDYNQMLNTAARAPEDHRSIYNGKAELLAGELVRLQAARQEVLAKMTTEERAAYDATQGEVVKTEEQIKAEVAEIARLMNENKDRPSH